MDFDANEWGLLWTVWEWLLRFLIGRIITIGYDSLVLADSYREGWFVKALTWWEEMKKRLLIVVTGWKKDNDVAGGDIFGVCGSQEKGPAVVCLLLVARSHGG